MLIQHAVDLLLHLLVKLHGVGRFFQRLVDSQLRSLAHEVVVEGLSVLLHLDFLGRELSGWSLFFLLAILAGIGIIIELVIAAPDTYLLAQVLDFLSSFLFDLLSDLPLLLYYLQMAHLLREQISFFLLVLSHELLKILPFGML